MILGNDRRKKAGKCDYIAKYFDYRSYVFYTNVGNVSNITSDNT